MSVPGCAIVGDVCMHAKEVIPPLPYAISLRCMEAALFASPPLVDPLGFRRVRGLDRRTRYEVLCFREAGVDCVRDGTRYC